MKMPFESHTVPAYFVSGQSLLSSLLPSQTEKTPLRHSLAQQGTGCLSHY